MNDLLPGFLPTELEAVAGLSLEQRKARAIELLKKHEPQRVITWRFLEEKTLAL